MTSPIHQASSPVIELSVALEESKAREKVLRDGLVREAHCANEWADMATNGIQWLRNIRDGISTVGEALDAMDSNLKHCDEVSRKTLLPATPDQTKSSLQSPAPLAQGEINGN